MSELELCLWGANRRLPQGYRREEPFALFASIEEWVGKLEDSALEEWDRVLEGYMVSDVKYIQEQVVRPLEEALELLHTALELVQCLQEETNDTTHDVS